MGIPSLTVTLFGATETQSYLNRVPVEYVCNAIKWLKNRGYEKIGINGMPKGSETVLVTASLFEEISCVIVQNPSHFVSKGITGHQMNKQPSGTSCWSYKGVELPFTTYKNRNFDMLKMLMKEKELHLIDYNKDKTVTPESLIPLE